MKTGNSKPVNKLAAIVTSTPKRIGRLVLLKKELKEGHKEEFVRYANPCNVHETTNKIILVQSNPEDKGWLNRNFARIKSFGIEADIRYE